MFCFVVFACLCVGLVWFDFCFFVFCLFLLFLFVCLLAFGFY